MRKNSKCSVFTESVIECARSLGEPDLALKRHLNVCPACHDRWEAERVLSAGLERYKTLVIHTPDRAADRAALLDRFARTRRKPVNRRWLWSMAAAALLLISVVLMRDLTGRPAAGINAVAVEEMNDPQQEGFIEVPYAPPLAQGELVRVVHTELQPAALSSLGVNVDPAWTAELPADLLLGQDGFPRAVRVSSDYSVEGGS